MKGECPVCKKEIDETEYMQNSGMCYTCSSNRKPKNRCICCGREIKVSMNKFCSFCESHASQEMKDKAIEIDNKKRGLKEKWRAI